MDNKLDRRILKSKKAIEKAFLELMLTNGFDKISVKQITEKANVARKTFYLHYTDIYDLLNAIVEKEMNQLEDVCRIKQGKSWVEGL
ncbi:MAG: TetR family transcriptional regulator [Synergistaceae bacterium]|nr:TetR family transcriptional regulator [Synergistaceae bacterium]